ncbi:MAG: amidohydrolase family protein [Candidatus Dormibacteraeota bacterium]|nr:amidohydrolase family protein [Candidatus Dormibacteraeota bacterium]MBO0743847.1 amidohydrolase family protein [Candidatus Dormibacteraeota bacterium]
MAAAAGRVDAHHHLWESHRRFPLSGDWLLGSVGYGWAEAGLPELDRDFAPSALAPSLAAAGVSSTIVVQAIHVEGETEWLLRVARATSSIAGVVGWMDLAAPSEVVHQRLTGLRDEGLVGVRHLVQFEPDPRWLLRTEVVRGLEVVAALGLPYDLLLVPSQLHLVPELSDRLPQLRMVIDHLAKPPIAAGVLDPWRGDIRRAAQNPNVYCKVSGMVTEADHRRWTPGDLRPYIEVVLEAFGPGRLMFGSDWPVCTLAATYGQVAGALEENLQELVGDDKGVREAIYRTTAAAFYGI